MVKPPSQYKDSLSSYGISIIQTRRETVLYSQWEFIYWWNSIFILRQAPISPYRVSHYDDVIMSTIASQITSLTIVYSTVYSSADQSKHQSSASLAFVWEIHRGPVNFPHKWPVTRKMFPFDDVIMKILGICFVATGTVTHFVLNFDLHEKPFHFLASTLETLSPLLHETVRKWTEQNRKVNSILVSRNRTYCEDEMG